MFDIACKILIAFSWQGETQINEFLINGKILKETESAYVVDFSEELSKMPIEGSPKNYSAMSVEKEKCTLYK